MKPVRKQNIQHNLKALCSSHEIHDDRSFVCSPPNNSVTNNQPYLRSNSRPVRHNQRQVTSIPPSFHQPHRRNFQRSPITLASFFPLGMYFIFFERFFKLLEVHIKNMSIKLASNIKTTFLYKIPTCVSFFFFKLTISFSLFLGWFESSAKSSQYTPKTIPITPKFAKNFNDFESRTSWPELVPSKTSLLNQFRQTSSSEKSLHVDRKLSGTVIAY